MVQETRRRLRLRTQRRTLLHKGCIHIRRQGCYAPEYLRHENHLGGTRGCRNGRHRPTTIGLPTSNCRATPTPAPVEKITPRFARIARHCRHNLVTQFRFRPRRQTGLVPYPQQPQRLLGRQRETMYELARNSKRGFVSLLPANGRRALAQIPLRSRENGHPGAALRCYQNGLG